MALYLIATGLSECWPKRHWDPCNKGCFLDQAERSMMKQGHGHAWFFYG